MPRMFLNVSLHDKLVYGLLGGGQMPIVEAPLIRVPRTRASYVDRLSVAGQLLLLQYTCGP